MNDTCPGNHADRNVVELIRDAGASLDVSRDLRHRILDGAYQQTRDDRAWHKAFFVCVLVTLLATAIGWWANRLPTFRVATSAASQWSAELSRIDPPSASGGRKILSWTGWSPWPEDRHEDGWQSDLNTTWKHLQRARGGG